MNDNDKHARRDFLQVKHREIIEFVIQQKSIYVSIRENKLRIEADGAISIRPRGANCIVIAFDAY